MSRHKKSLEKALERYTKVIKAAEKAKKKE